MTQNQARRRFGYTIVMAIPVAAVVVLTILVISRLGPSSRHIYTAPPPGPAVHAAVPPATRYVGIYEPGTPNSWTPVSTFTTATRVRPGIVLYYSSWWKPFPTRFAEQAHSHGAIPFAQLIPYGKGVSLRQLIAGQYDGYLRTFAEQVRRYGHPVIIGFAPEPNGHWYSWGWRRLPPSVWITAWRHVVNAFRAQGARNVIWLWTVNRNLPQTGPVRDWWPGSNYVTWAGIDGYYVGRNATFRTVFGSTLADVRAITSKPIILSETAIARAFPQRHMITSLAAGISRNHLLGFVWFDAISHVANHTDWRLARTPAVLAAFRAGVALLTNGGGR
jgi:mannan endo-1,4-beta-mannosidase